jgi:hypothetical protein
VIVAIHAPATRLRSGIGYARYCRTKSCSRGRRRPPSTSITGLPNEEIWPALEAATYPLVLVASAMCDRFANAVPRAQIERGAGHEIDYGAVAAALSRTRAHTHGAARNATTPPA